MHFSKILGYLSLALGLFLLPACGLAGQSSTPTQDSNKILTEVAITVQSRLTQMAAQTPSATPSPLPTATQPSPTIQPGSPTVAATLTPSGTPPTITPGASPTGVAGGDKAEFIKQSILDKSKFAPGTAFSVTWTFRNAGKNIWTPEYAARYWSDDRMDSPDSTKIGKEVKPGESVDLTINFKAPLTDGVYKSTWWLQSANGVNFYPFFIQIEVVSSLSTPPTATLGTPTPPTATATVAPPTDTATPTITPTK
jgi:hypothetical protein